MIRISNLTKTFSSIPALSGVDLEIPDNSIFGLLGTNGAGKSTLLRILAGILRPDHGEIFIDNEKLSDTSKARQTIFYLSDDQYHFPGSTPQTMLLFYEKMYPGFDSGRFLKLLSDFHLDSTQKLHTFSKGMKKQVFLIAALYCGFFLQKSAPKDASFLWLFAGIAFGAVAAHGLLQDSFFGTVRNFLQNKVSLLLTLSLSAATACIFVFDLFSYDSFLPSRHNLASMAVSIDGIDTNDTYAAPEETALHNMKLQGDSLNTAYTWCRSLSSSEEIPENSYTSAVVLYRTTSGKKIYRRYPVTDSDALLAFDPVYTSGKYKKGIFPLLSGAGHTAKRNLIWSDGISRYVLDLSTEEKEELLSIYSEEMIALSLSTLQTEFPCGSLTLSYPRTDTGDGGLIYPSFHRTINYLKEHRIPAQNTIETYTLVSAERFRVLENGYRASEALYESEEELEKLASQLVIRDFAVNPLLYPVDPSCEILLKAKDLSSGSILEADCALRR